MSVHDVLVPLRFLALLGHFLATLLCLYAVRDNVLVALPFTYDAVSMENGLWSARFATYVTFAVLLVNADASPERLSSRPLPLGGREDAFGKE